MEEERLKTLKNNEHYEVDVNLKINPKLHRKMFSFFTFCFEYWSAENGFSKFANEKAQFEELREFLLIQAGHCEQIFSVTNPREFKIVAKSVSYKELEDDIKRRELYVALNNAAMATIFKHCRDEQIINRLYAFF